MRGSVASGFCGSDAYHGLDREKGGLAALRHGAVEEESLFVKRKAPVIVEKNLLYEGAYK